MKTRFSLKAASTTVLLVSCWLAAPAQTVGPGSALNLSGGSQYAQVPPDPGLTPSQLTFEAWVNPNSAHCNTILSRGDGNNGNFTDFIFQVGYDGTTCGVMKLAFFGAGAWDSSTNSVPLNTWTHVAVTFDGNIKQFFINGVPDRTASRPGTLFQSGFPLYIGRQGTFCDCNFFQGLLDEVRIWNVVRTPAQIQQDMNQALTGTEAGLVAYYRMDEGSGTTLTNSASTGAIFNAGCSNAPGWVTSGVPFIPDVSTSPATNISMIGATLNGWINPGNLPTTAGFQWGTNTANYSPLTSQVSLPATNAALAINTFLSGLSPGTTYFFRVLAQNSAGTHYGSDQAFTTIGAPTVTTLPADNITLTNAVLNGTANPNGLATTAWFEWGTTPAYGNTTAPSAIGATNSPAAVSGLIGNLSPATIYHFRLVATNSAGAHFGGDQSFNTASFNLLDAGLPGVNYGSAAWGDYNNDGRLDILVSGSGANGEISQVWQNTGGGFSNINAGLPGAGFSSVAWGDFNNDGWLDILFSGAGQHGPITELWQNTGSGFTSINSGLTSFYEGSVAWGDYNNDGRLDILLTGGLISQPIPLTQLWQNTGSGFTNNGIAFTGVSVSSVAWGDYDNDGLLDILISGSDASNNPITQVWRNTGNGFTNINAGLPGVANGSVAWGDYDNDGLLDILISGSDASNNPITQVWRNTGNGFTNINAGLSGVAYSSVAWGDYDNDGRLDILLSGMDADSNRITQVWRNTGTNFININAGLPGVWLGSVAWGDYDNDGRLDILISGQDTNNNPITQVWLNQFPATNSRPAAPSGLAAALSPQSSLGATVILSWNASSDAQTPASGLSYNLRVGTTPGGSDVVAPAADPATGLRRLPQRGAQQTLSAILTGLLPGRYYWSVQAIDTAFAGSPFAPEGQFTILSPVAVTGTAGQVTTTSAVLEGTATANGFDTTAWFEWLQWGTAITSGSTPSVLVPATSSGPVALSATVTGLSPLTQYFYRLVASNVVNQSYGQVLSFTTPGTSGPPAITSITPAPGNTFLLQFSGTPGSGYTLWASTNLVTWSVLTNLTADPNGLFQFTTDSTNYPALFFRLSSP